MSTTPAVVQIRNLTKKIGKKTIVENLTFDIPRGEVFGFLGPNGAGKTTTIRMIVGLIGISSGQVLINGVDVEKNFEGAIKHVGAIVENPEMYKFLSGYNNLVHFARMSGIGKARIEEVIKLVGLEARIHDKVKTYSLGMRQRLGLAQALLHKPSVLILDEPTNGLDPAGIRELRDHLRQLAADEGIAVIVSSHLLSEMEMMCDRVAIIQHGKLVSVKTLHEMMSEDNDQAVLIEVDQVQDAKALLSRTLQGLSVSVHEGALLLPISREEVPMIITQLVQGGFKVYGIQTVAKTLEEKFLEITGGGHIA